MPFDARTVESWIFDLDNTLYPARSNLFDQVRERITDYVERHVGLARPAARDLQRDLFQRYGTTMNGLMAEHGLDPHDFLAYVHDIDYSPIDPDPRLDALLADLSGRKMIYTNGSVAHAQRLRQTRRQPSFRGLFRYRGGRFSAQTRPGAISRLSRRRSHRPGTRGVCRGHGDQPGTGRRARPDHRLAAHRGGLGDGRRRRRPCPPPGRGFGQFS